MLKHSFGWVSRVHNYRLISGQVVSLYTATNQKLASHTQVGLFRHFLVTAFTSPFPPYFYQHFIRYFNSYTLYPQDL